MQLNVTHLLHHLILCWHKISEASFHGSLSECELRYIFADGEYFGEPVWMHTFACVYTVCICI